ATTPHPRNTCTRKLLPLQPRLQASEITLPVGSVLRLIDRARAGVACVNVNARPVKPTRLVKRHRDCERLLASGACCAPDVQSMIRMGLEILRNDVIHKSADLADLAPEERLLNCQRVKDVPPF